MHKQPNRCAEIKGLQTTAGFVALEPHLCRTIFQVWTSEIVNYLSCFAEQNSVGVTPPGRKAHTSGTIRSEYRLLSFSVIKQAATVDHRQVGFNVLKWDNVRAQSSIFFSFFFNKAEWLQQLSSSIWSDAEGFIRDRFPCSAGHKADVDGEIRDVSTPL